MNHQVVVAVDGELSARDASAAAAHRATDGPVDFHLLIATKEASASGLAMLGMRPGDTFGSAALARHMNVRPAEDEDQSGSGLGEIMAQSASHLRAAGGGNVTVSITHGDMLSGARNLVETTGSQEVVIVTEPGRYPQFAMPEWTRKLSVYLGVPRVRTIQHVE
ncbi:hypothetical protein [Kribbella speibonae]|uniref:Universal stress protein n=1 Tax=Kribbella speibonae TaxID=1572660 RepID=A0ABY2AC92_9ACTN|nr:hypothetical protein [Kribbella speibonae]TCC26885.1 hypothetical protein E0H58_02425 [Kribbella speibonae]